MNKKFIIGLSICLSPVIVHSCDSCDENSASQESEIANAYMNDTESFINLFLEIVKTIKNLGLKVSSELEERNEEMQSNFKLEKKQIKLWLEGKMSYGDMDIKKLQESFDRFAMMKNKNVEFFKKMIKGVIAAPVSDDDVDKIFNQYKERYLKTVEAVFTSFSKFIECVKRKK